MTIRHRAAALLSRLPILKGNPTGSSLHVPAPMGETDDEKKKRRARAAAAALGYNAVEKADSAQYIGRQVLNAGHLAAWWSSVAPENASRVCDPNPHITVAYSSTEFEWVIDRSLVVIQPEAFDGLGLLGPDNAVVLFLNSPLLESRWQAMRDAGGSWSYDGYKPHVTLCYLGAEYDQKLGAYQADQIVQPDFPIVLGPELMAKGGTDVFEAVKAPQWYQDAKGVTKGT